MSDIIFYCTDCETRLVIDEEGIGMQISCPVCTAEVTVPGEPQAPPLATSESGSREISAERIEAKARELHRKITLAAGHQPSPVLRAEDKALDISFYCTHCLTHLVVESSGAGLEITCPSCDAEIEIPDPLELPDDFPVDILVEKLVVLQKSTTGARFGQFQAAPESMPLKPRRITIKRNQNAAQMMTESGLSFGGDDEANLFPGGSSGVPMISEAGLTAPSAPANSQPLRAKRSNRNQRNRGPLRFEPKDQSNLTLRLPLAPASADEAMERREKLLQKAAQAEDRDVVPKHLAESHGAKSSQETRRNPSEQRRKSHTGPIPPEELLDTPNPLTPQSSNRERAFSRPKPNQTSRSLRNITLGALPFFLIWIGVMIYVLTATQTHPVIPPDPLAQPDNLRPDEYYIVELDQLELRTLRHVVRAYCEAENWQEAAQYVRNPEITAPIMAEYYETHEWSQIPVDQVEVRRAGWMNDRLLALVTVVSSDTYKEFFFITERVGVTYKIDWETLVEYNAISWPELRQLRPREPVQMRANIARGEYYNFQFSDSQKYACFEIRSRDEGFLGIYGYVERNSELHQTLQGLVASGNPAAVMIKLRYPEDPQSGDLVEITEFVRAGWMNL